MDNNEHGKQPEAVAKTKVHKTSSLKSFVRFMTSLVLVALIFGSGLLIGNGTIAITGFSSTSQNKSLPDNLDYSEVERLYDTLRENFDGELTLEQLLEGLKTGLISAAGDTYTEYFDPEAAEELNNQLSGTFSGIGAELGKDANDNLIIVAPISGFPAEKAGLRAQDIIVSIDGTTTSGLSVNDAVTKIRGKKGTDVTLQIIRGGSEQKEFKITRDTITIPSVTHEILEGNVGYIRISQFWTDTASLTQQAASEFKAAGVKSVVLDMRGNPGGSLDAAVAVASIWLPNGKTILQEKRDGQVIQTYTATGAPTLLGVNTRVLVDAGSASASEIVAGALKDNNAAKLVGIKTYGKGSVQQIIPLSNGGELKVTIARWFRPNGENIDKKGIAPDTEVKMSEDDYTNKRDPQKDAAIAQLKQ